MSPLTEAMIINGAVLIAVLEGDLGSHRKIGRFRILRPLITIAVIIPLFIDSPVTHGNGLLIELAGLAACLLCGVVVAALMRVYRSPKTGQPVSAAGFPYALVWIIVVGARALAWGEGAGQLTNSEWRERAAKAHGALEQPTLFTAPLVAPETPAETPWPAIEVAAVAPEGRRLTWREAMERRANV